MSDIKIDPVLKGCFSVMLSDGETFIKCINMLEPSYFQPPLNRVVEYIKKEYNSLQKPIPIDMVNATFDLDFSLQAPEQMDTLAPLAVGKLEEYCKYSAMMQAITTGADLIATGLEEEDIEVKNGILKTLVEDALKVGLESDIGISLFNEDVEERHKKMLESIDTTSTGFRDIDRVIGGWGRGQLIMFLAPSGYGKSITLANIARIMSEKRDVVYITFELDEDRVAGRFDAMFGSIDTKKLMEHSQMLQELYDNKNTRLQVKRMPQGTNAIQIRAFLSEYYAQFGKYPETLILDHMDLMWPNDKRAIRDGAFERDKAIAEEMREIFAEFNMYGFTASQLNREAIGATKYDHHHTGGGISKIQTADIAIGIHRGEDYRKEQAVGFQFLKLRNDEDPCQLVFLKFDPCTLRIEDLPDDEVARLKRLFNGDVVEEATKKNPKKTKVNTSKSVKDAIASFSK